MVQVPVKKYAGTEQITALPGVRRDPSAPAGAFGVDIRPAAANIADVAMFEQRKANEIAVMDADRRLAEFENSALYDSKNGALNLRGKDAFDAPERVIGEYDKLYGEAYNALGNDAQKQAFQRYGLSRRRDVDRTLQQHVSKERRRYDDETTESLVANELQAAVFNHTDPERIAHSVERITYHYSAYAKRNGLPGDWSKRKIEETVSKAHAGVVQRYLATGDDILASKYYKVNKGSVSGTDAVILERAIEEGSIRGESQRRADEIILKHGQDADRAAAMEEVKKIDDPKVRDAATSRIESYFTNKHTAETERRDKQFIAATNVVDRTMDETKINSSVWSNLTLGQRAALKEYAKNKREGVEPTLDHPTWVKFTFQTEQQLARLTDAQFMELYYPKLDKPHRDRGLEMMRQARESAAKGVTDPKFATTVTFKDITRSMLESVGVIVPGESESKWDKETARRYSVFESEAWRAVQQYEMTQLGGKRPASREEMQLVMDRLLLNKVFLDEWGRDPEVPAVLVDKDKRGNAYVPFDRIPKSIRIESVNLAKSVGNIPQNMPQAQAERLLLNRIQRAYGARLTGAGRQEIIDIIGGRR
jgi:hypothetical protein